MGAKDQYFSDRFWITSNKLVGSEEPDPKALSRSKEDGNFGFDDLTIFLERFDDFIRDSGEKIEPGILDKILKDNQTTTNKDTNPNGDDGTDSIDTVPGTKVVIADSKPEQEDNQQKKKTVNEPGGIGGLIKLPIHLVKAVYNWQQNKKD